LDGEGFVVRDSAFQRIKIKSPQYVALALMKDQMTERRMLEVVRQNEAPEFLTYFPEMQPMYDAISAKFNAMCSLVESEYEPLRAIKEQKEFAAAALKTHCSGALFAMRSGKAANAKAYFATATLQAVERALGEH
jgi:hypothetical protein